MAINKIIDPSATPSAIADYTAQNNLTKALLLAVQGAQRVSGSNILKGAVFQVGGATYLADADTAITGSASDYVKLTVSVDGLTLAPSFVADLTGVTWSSTWNGYYDVSGNLYEFDETKAYSNGAILAINLRSIDGKNVASLWAKTILQSTLFEGTQSGEIDLANALDITKTIGTDSDEKWLYLFISQAQGSTFRSLTIGVCDGGTVFAPGGLSTETQVTAVRLV
jgi:hypothetical protein